MPAESVARRRRSLHPQLPGHHGDLEVGQNTDVLGFLGLQCLEQDRRIPSLCFVEMMRQNKEIQGLPAWQHASASALPPPNSDADSSPPHIHTHSVIEEEEKG